MITVVPAYGRDYKSAKAVKLDWQANKDFIVADYFHPADGKAINKQDAGNELVKVRYNKLRNVVVIAKGE